MVHFFYFKTLHVPGTFVYCVSSLIADGDQIADSHENGIFELEQRLLPALPTSLLPIEADRLAMQHLKKRRANGTRAYVAKRLGAGLGVLLGLYVAWRVVVSRHTPSTKHP